MSSDAPKVETIWAWDETGEDCEMDGFREGEWTSKPYDVPYMTAYRRVDLPPTLEAAMQLPEVRALRDAAKNAEVSLFEAEDKFHVLSFYLNDEPSLKCAKERVEWMRASGASLNVALAPFAEGQVMGDSKQVDPAQMTIQEAAKVLLDTMTGNRAVFDKMVEAAEDTHSAGASFNVVVGNALRAVAREKL